MISQKLRVSWLIATIAASISACGGGGGAPPANPGGGGGPIGGITGTGAFVAIGTINGFGSIIVNGVEYDTSTAAFTIDGDTDVSQNDLAVGDIVLVRGTIDDDNISNGVAESVEFDDNVEGPIEVGSISIDPMDRTTGTFVVLGQTVYFDFYTSFDDSISPASIDGLSDGDIVEVSGLVRWDGGIQASRIEPKTVLPGDLFEVTGIVAESSLTPSSFKINELVVDFVTRSATFDNFPGGRDIAEGDPVEVKGEQTLGLAGELIATRVEYKGDRLNGDDGDHMEIEGFITDFDPADPQHFDVSYHPVFCGDGCTITTEGQDGGTLALNVKVEVKGQLEFGELVATSVDIRLTNIVRVTTTLLANAGAVDADGKGSFVMLGITINFDRRTRFEDKDGQAMTEISNAGQLTTGDYVEVRGQEDGSGGVFAVIVERDDLDTETILQGFIEIGGVNKPTLDILGVRVVTDEFTVFQNDDESIITDPDHPEFGFWPRVGGGSVIKAKGQSTTVMDLSNPPPFVTFTAEEVEIQME